MPTLQEINAKRKELGVSAIEASKALQATPTTPTPTSTPVTPTPIAQPIDQQTIQGVNGETFKVAPINNQGVTPQAQPTTPTTPKTPTTPATPTPTQPPAPTIDKSADIKAQNEAQMALNKQQAELRQQERNQVAQENKIANTPTDSGNIFNTIKMGGSVPKQDTPEYRQAQARFATYKKFTTYDVASLSTALQSGDLLMGTQAFTDLTSDPAMLAKIQRARAFTNGNIDINVVGEKSGQYIMSSNPTVAQALSDGYMSQEEYDSLTNNAEVATQAKVVSENKSKYDEYRRQLESISDVVDQEYEGKQVTEEFKNAIKSNRDKDIRRLFNSASDEYQNSMGLYTELKNSSTNLLEINMKQYETKKAEEAQIAQEQRAMKNSLALSQMEFDQKITQQAQAMNDPTQAISSMVEEYKKLGIPFSRSTQQIIQDFQTSGQDLPTYLSSLQGQIQSKPEYQKMQSLQMGQLSDVQKMNLVYQQDLSKIQMQQNFEMKMAQAKNVADNKWTKLDDGLYQDASGNIVTADEMKQAKLFNNSYLTKSVGEEGGDCGFYASRGTGMTSTPGGNSKDARTKAFSDITPQVGGMAFFGGSGYDPTYGHIGIVTAVNPDGTIQVKDSNYNGDGKVTERTVPASTATGFYNNTPLAKGAGVSQGPSQEAQAWVNAWNNGTMDIETILTKIGSTKEAMPLKNEVIKAIDAQGGVAWRKDNDPMVSKVQDLIDKLDKSEKSSYINTVAGTVQTSLTNFLTQGKSDLLADLKSVVEGGTLQQLIDAKSQGATFGALSNEELKMLQATSSALAGNAIRDPDTKEIVGFKMSEAKLKSEIQKLKNLLQEKKDRMTGVGLKTEQITQSKQGQARTNTGAGAVQYQGYTLKPM